tara:strand:+ start:932 stop:1834 length:903 start_codon:yes stop_codon:yes gene_type:complete
MAYYAKISNQEFTESESARLMEARHEKSVIENNNRASDGYVALKTAYQDSFTSATLQTLQGELAVLQSQEIYMMTEEEILVRNTSITEKQAEIDSEKAALIPGQEAALASLNAKEAEGTEALTTEIETLNTAIANALCRVTAMYTGVDEFTSSNGEVTEVDNSAYWEGYYGGCKRTSYNTQGGVHKLGGTPFRKNYAGVGYIYDPVRDAFYSQQPYASWILDESTCYWQPPTPRPEGMDWYWKEDTTEWVDYVYINPDNNQPFPSWTWDTTNGGWNPPIERPNDGFEYYWVEDTLTWVER